MIRKLVFEDRTPMNFRSVIYMDCYNCDVCGEVTTYMGLEAKHHPCCQSCQDELARGQGMSSKFRKLYLKKLALPKSEGVAE